MDANDTNTQIQPDATPAAAGPTAAELQAQLEEIKKQSEGRLRDLQQERARRQELESRVASPASSAANPDVTEDELGKVLTPHIARVTAPLKQELENLRLEKAQQYLEKQTGKSWNEIEADHDFQGRMTAVIRKYGVTGNVYDMTVRAHELMQLEDLKTKEEERKRAATVAKTQTLPTGTSPVSTSNAKRYSADEFKKLPYREFDKMSDAGSFRKLPDGTFEYTPR